MPEKINGPTSPGQTPLNLFELEGLIPAINSKFELDEAEAENILLARTWIYARRRKFSVKQILTPDWVKELHSQMFGDVWTWAGKYRTTQKNIGAEAYLVPIEVVSMLQQVEARISNSKLWNFSNQQIALEFAHKAVQIHPFSNGNGRWSRDLADALLNSMGEPQFTWGASFPKNEQHKAMINAVQLADTGQFEEFMYFAMH